MTPTKNQQLLPHPPRSPSLKPSPHDSMQRSVRTRRLSEAWHRELHGWSPAATPPVHQHLPGDPEPPIPRLSPYRRYRRRQHRPREARPATNPPHTPPPPPAPRYLRATFAIHSVCRKIPMLGTLATKHRAAIRKTTESPGLKLLSFPDLTPRWQRRFRRSMIGWSRTCSRQSDPWAAAHAATGDPRPAMRQDRHAGLPPPSVRRPMQPARQATSA